MYINIIYRAPSMVPSVANFKIQEEQLYTIKKYNVIKKENTSKYKLNYFIITHPSTFMQSKNYYFNNIQFPVNFLHLKSIRNANHRCMNSPIFVPNVVDGWWLSALGSRHPLGKKAFGHSSAVDGDLSTT